MIVDSVPICYPFDAKWLSHLYFLHSLHYRIIYIGIIYGLCRDVAVAIWISPLSIIIYFLAVGLQYLIAQPRPYPSCVPFYMYNYGMPAPEIVTISSFTVGMICTLFYDHINNKQERVHTIIGYQSGRRRIRKRTCWDEIIICFKWGYWGVSIAVTIFVYIAHPVYMVMFRIVSLQQAIVSVVIGTVTTITIYFGVGAIVNCM